MAIDPNWNVVMVLRRWWRHHHKDHRERVRDLGDHDVHSGAHERRGILRGVQCKGVVQEYPMTVTELCNGLSLALEIRAQDATQAFCEFCGPSDPVRFYGPFL